MRISDWSSDVCSSDLGAPQFGAAGAGLDPGADRRRVAGRKRNRARLRASDRASVVPWLEGRARRRGAAYLAAAGRDLRLGHQRSEEHTSELQSLMRISYAVFCLKKKKNKLTTT